MNNEFLLAEQLRQAQHRLAETEAKAQRQRDEVIRLHVGIASEKGQ